MPRKEVARTFRVTEQLVSDLVCEARTKPEKLRVAKANEKLLSQKMASIEETVLSLQREDKEIHNASMVSLQVKDIYDLEVTEKLVRQVMSERCKLSFI